MFVFVQTCHNYADEFGVESCFVQPKSHWEADLEKIKAAFDTGNLKNQEFYFGTNEFLQFENFDDFIGGVEVKECSEQFHDEFKQLTGGSLGTSDVIDQMLDRMN